MCRVAWVPAWARRRVTSFASSIAPRTPEGGLLTSDLASKISPRSRPGRPRRLFSFQGLVCPLGQCSGLVQLDGHAALTRGIRVRFLGPEPCAAVRVTRGQGHGFGEGGRQRRPLQVFDNRREIDVGAFADALSSHSGVCGLRTRLNNGRSRFDSGGWDFQVRGVRASVAGSYPAGGGSNPSGPTDDFDVCGSGGIGRPAGLRNLCSSSVPVRLRRAAPDRRASSKRGG